MVINEVTILVWIVCGIGSFLIAQSRGATNAPTWFLVGILFGPIGIILAAIGAKPQKGQKRDDALETLRGLAEMRSRGDLTTEEYEGKKADLLNRL